jgi:PAS domain S-box-containing protein
MIDCPISPVDGDFQLIATSNPTIQLVSSLAYTPSHKHDAHVVQLYTDDGFLIDVLSRFVGGALAVGDGAVVVATKSHRVALERRLSAHGLDAAKAILQGRFVVLDATETLSKLMVNGSVDDRRFNDIIGGVLTQVRSAVDGTERRVAVFGELVALLWAEGKPQMAIRVEQLWNDLAESHSFSLLCAYPMTGFHNETHIEPFLTMCGQHSGVVPSESYLGLGSEEERLRSIAQLQQRALALEKELALRQSEERFRLLVEAVQDYAIFMLDPDGKVSSWNIGAERLKGYRATDIIGKHFSCFYPEEDKREGKPDWELVIALKDGRFEDEGWRIRKDGSRFWASVVITAVRDDSGKLLGFAKITRDFTERIEIQKALHKEVAERRDAQRQLHNSEKSLRELSLHLLRTQDEERRRIGRDLHDSLGQYLAVLKMKLESVASSAGQNDVEASEDLAQCIRLTQDSIKEVRTVAYLLYPPMLEELGLQSAIPWYLDGFSERSSIQTTFKVQAGLRRLLRDGELALFRVLQESLTNVHRHSGSKIAHVRLLTKKGMCILEIEDEGKGIPSQVLEQSTQDWTGSQGVGVRGMNERLRQLGGRLELMSKKTGTTVRAMIPAGEPSSVTRT